MTTFSNEFPTEGQLLGVDYGTVRVGLSISTREQTIASPLEIYQRRNERLDAKYYIDLVNDHRVKGLIVGLPMHVNGEEGATASQARAYGAWLHEITKLPVHFWDERYTSAVAEEYLLGADMTRKKRKKRLDMIAAQILLQSYLDTQAKRRSEAENANDKISQSPS